VSTAVAVTSFTASLDKTNQPSEVGRNVKAIAQVFSTYLKADIPPEWVSKATREEDLNGVDYWFANPNGQERCIGVDVIKRFRNTVCNWKRGEAELTIELVSRAEDKAPSKFAKTGDGLPDWYLFMFAEKPNLMLLVPGPVMREAFAAGKFDPYLNRAKIVETYRPDYLETWKSLCTFLTISEMRSIIPGMVVVGDYRV
jgi:hypothetical protein